MNWYKKAQFDYNDQEEFSSNSLSPEEAKDTIQKNRAGSELSKRKGRIDPYEKEWGKMTLIDFPLSLLRDDQIEWYADSTNTERVDSYSTQQIDTPVVFTLNQKGTLVLSDGGHRIMAALKRGDKTIKALVPVEAFPILRKYYNELV